MIAFREFVNDCSLMEVECKDFAFTWTNNRGGEEFVNEKLDRVFCKVNWRVLFIDAKVYALPEVGLDRSPIVLSLSPESVKRRKDLK